MMSGTDFLIGKILGKGKRQSIAPEGIAVTREQIDDAIAATAGAAKKMASGVSLAKRQLDEIRSSGLTGEALVVLVHSRCLPVKNARRPHVDSVSRAGSGRARGALLHRRARAIAPSADKAMKLGVTKLKDERKYPPIKGERMRFFRFQFEVGGRRHQLDITWHNPRRRLGGRAALGQETSERRTRMQLVSNAQDQRQRETGINRRQLELADSGIFKDNVERWKKELAAK